MSDDGSRISDEEGGYRRLEVYKLSRRLALPPFEMHEEGAQIRRSSKRISAGIVEGYAMRAYKAEFLLYLQRSLASSDETHEHLLYVWQAKSLKDKAWFERLEAGYRELSRKLARFIQGVRRHHRTSKSPESGIGHPASGIQETVS